MGGGGRSRSKKRRCSLACRSRQQKTLKAASYPQENPGPAWGDPGRAPKAISKVGTAAPAMMEEVAYRLTDALLRVASNKGAPGPDGQTIEALCEQWPVALPRLQGDLLEGTYRPGEIRRAFIPKAGGGQRGLGIPDVVDRVVQEAVRQVLEPLWEPTFHPSSHGFRPGRSCHTAITEAKGHLEDGYEWVVDLDLEKFFDLVCHQRLMAKLAERVSDRRLLALIGRMLKAKVVLPDGVAIASEQGVPQGGPLAVAVEHRAGIDPASFRSAWSSVCSCRRCQRVRRKRTRGATGDGQPDRVHRTAFAPEGESGQVGCRPPRGSPLPRIPATSRSAVRDRGVLSERTKRNAMERGPSAHAENSGKHAGVVHLSDLDRWVRRLACRCGRRRDRDRRWESPADAGLSVRFDCQITGCEKRN